MTKLNKSLAIAITTAMASTVAINAQASDNPFEINKLDSGYEVAMSKDGKGKKKDGKCGEGKCGGSKAKKKDAKCGEGKCGSSKKKKKDAKCGEGKCGSK